MRKILLSMLTLMMGSAVSLQAEIVTDLAVDFTTLDTYPYFVMTDKAVINDGVLEYTNETATNTWAVQFYIADLLTYNPNAIYTVTTEVKGSVAGTVPVIMGNWSANTSTTLEVPTEWQKVSFRATSVPETSGSGFVILQAGQYVGTIQFRNTTVTHDTETEADLTVGNVVDKTVDFSQYTEYPFYRMSDVPTINADGQLEVVNETKLGDYQVQYFVIDSAPLIDGNDYKLTAEVRGTADGNIVVNVGNWSCGVSTGNLTVTASEDFQTVTTRILDAKTDDGKAFALFKTGAYVGTLQIKSVTISHDEAVEDPGDATAIEAVKATQKAAAPIYNLAGQRVMGHKSAGIYVQDGKMILVK
jgi:hypothetical protein